MNLQLGSWSQRAIRESWGLSMNRRSVAAALLAAGAVGFQPGGRMPPATAGRMPAATDGRFMERIAVGGREA
jgi:hypothetical protein